MEFKRLVAVFCLVSVKVSEAQVDWSLTTTAVSVSECAFSGTAIAYTGTTLFGPHTFPVTYTLKSQTPDSTTKKFAVAQATGALTKVTSAISDFDSTIYVVVITATDSAVPVPFTDDLAIIVIVTDTGCSSGAGSVISTVAVMLFALFSPLMKNTN